MRSRTYGVSTGYRKLFECNLSGDGAPTRLRTYIYRAQRAGQRFFCIAAIRFTEFPNLLEIFEGE
jgi:hypothetical protein